MEVRTDFYLLEAGEKDCDLLFQWVNTPAVRRGAFNMGQIPYETHVEWFRRVLEDNTIRQYILYHEAIPVGQIRINIEDGIGLIDYSIPPNMWGHGFGSLILTLLKEKLEKEKKEKGKEAVRKLKGQVKYENTASQKAFESCGYMKEKKEEYIEFELDLG